jgi:hypothetical protein
MAADTTEAAEAAGAKPTQIDPEKLKHRLQILSKVGRGAFGTVYKGAPLLPGLRRPVCARAPGQSRAAPCPRARALPARRHI